MSNVRPHAKSGCFGKRLLQDCCLPLVAFLEVLAAQAMQVRRPTLKQYCCFESSPSGARAAHGHTRKESRGVRCVLGRIEPQERFSQSVELPDTRLRVSCATREALVASSPTGS